MTAARRLRTTCVTLAAATAVFASSVPAFAQETVTSHTDESLRVTYPDGPLHLTLPGPGTFDTGRAAVTNTAPGPMDVTITSSWPDTRTAAAGAEALRDILPGISRPRKAAARMRCAQTSGRTSASRTPSNPERSGMSASWRPFPRCPGDRSGDFVVLRGGVRCHSGQPLPSAPESTQPVNCPNTPAEPSRGGAKASEDGDHAAPPALLQEERAPPRSRVPRQNTTLMGMTRHQADAEPRAWASPTQGLLRRSCSPSVRFSPRRASWRRVGTADMGVRCEPLPAPAHRCGRCMRAGRPDDPPGGGSTHSQWTDQAVITGTVSVAGDADSESAPPPEPSGEARHGLD